MYKVLGLILSIALTASVASTASASYGEKCTTVYGGGNVCTTDASFTVNKLIQLPTKGEQFVDNLTINDTTYGVNQSIMFKIVVKNTGNTKINKLTVVDTLPSEVTYVAGPGSFNSANNTLTINIDGLEAGKEAVYFITTKVVNFSDSKCPVNNVVVTASNGAQASDNASFCMTKTGAKIQEKPVMKKQPETGPESLAIAIMSAAGAAGFYIRKRTK